MYGLLWKVLPGPWPVRALILAVLAAAVVLFCFMVLFPAIAPLLPVNDASVSQ